MRILPFARYLLVLTLPVSTTAWSDAIDCAPEAVGGVTLVKYGDNVSCTFDDLVDADVFQFEGTAGDLTFIATSGTNNSSRLRLTAPDATVLRETPWSDVPTIDNVILPSTGT